MREEARFDCPTILLPLKINPQIGRPPKKRKKSKGEIEMVKGNNLIRKGKTVSCGNCQGTRHNRRSCSNGQSPKSVPLKSVGKKRTATQVSQVAQGSHVAQGSQDAQGSQGPTQGSQVVKRTKKSTSRLTSEKSKK